MSVLDKLEPKAVFHYFERLCAIPHGSRNTRAVSDFVAEFARKRGLRYIQDAANNVIIFKDAAPGYEAAAPVILQGHLDMVCEKDPDCDLDMEREGLRLAVEGDTVLARGTTLGGDDGIAVAMMLALLDDPAAAHPPLECVFTADEEIGMLGAAALDLSPLRGRRMINLDSEDEGIFTVGCAGGRTAAVTLPLTREAFDGSPLRLEIGGLQGGHSGAEIHKGRANANQLLGRAVSALAKKTPLRLVSVVGGAKDNAIPARASAELLVKDSAAADQARRELEAAVREEYAVTDSGVRITLKASEAEDTPMSAGSTERVLTFLLCAPGGIQDMSPDIPGLVRSSLNLGILTTESEAVKATFSIRSSLESRKELITDRVTALAESLGGSVSLTGDYPGWAFRRESSLRELMTAVFKEQYGREPKIEAIHAGLECGMFSGGLPGLDCVSIGPDMTDIHTPRERLHIASAARVWQFVLEVLRRMK